MDILQRLKRHLVMRKFATQQDLYAEMDADRRDAAEEIELLRRALDDLGVTPEEARAGALLSIDTQNEIKRLRARLEWDSECPEQDGIYCRDETIRLQDRQIANLKSALESKQAKIDALMLEFCPGEMPAAQVENWAKHQRPVDENTRDAINSAASEHAEIAKLRAEAEALRRDAERHRLARLCAHVDPHGAWHIFPGDTHDVEEAAQRYDTDMDAAITEQALQHMTDNAQAMGLYDVLGDEKR